MVGRVAILRPLGECRVGDHVGVEINGAVVEGRITFLARTPGGGWILTFETDGSSFEVYCAKGTCTMVSQLIDECRWTYEGGNHAIDSTTGRRFSYARDY